MRHVVGDSNRLHHRYRPEAAATVEDERRGAVAQQTRLRLWVDFAALDHVQVRRQARNAVSIYAAQIGPDQSIGDHAGVRHTRALGNQRVADEPRQFLVTDNHHTRAGK